MRTILMMAGAAALIAPAAWARTVQPDGLCTSALAALQGTGPALACAEAPLGVGLAPDSDRAGQLARLGQAGEIRFRRHFGRDPARYAVIEFDDPAGLTARQRALNEAGFRRTLPWFSRRTYAEQVNRSARDGAEASARDDGADEQAVAQAGDRAVSDQVENLAVFELDTTEASVVPHEIGHGWYTEAFWPGFQMDAAGHYGGPGPDWLDETAPILMESGDSAEERRALFRDVYRGNGPGIFAGYAVSRLIDLPRFLSRDHPGKNQNAEEKAEANRTGSPVVRVLAGEAAAGHIANAREAALFYSQGRVFADFLIDRTGHPAVFGSLGDAFGRGETIEQWLAGDGDVKGLAASVTRLDRDWRAWLEARFGQPAIDRSQE